MERGTSSKRERPTPSRRYYKVKMETVELGGGQRPDTSTVFFPVTSPLI